MLAHYSTHAHWQVYDCREKRWRNDVRWVDDTRQCYATLNPNPPDVIADGYEIEHPSRVACIKVLEVCWINIIDPDWNASKKDYELEPFKVDA